MFRDLTIPLSTVRVAPFANAIHSAERKMWVKWRQGVAKGSVYLDASLGQELAAGEMSKCSANMYISKGNKISTVDGKLTAIRNLHLSVRDELPMKNNVIKPVKAQITREGVLRGEGPWIRSPIWWVMLRYG